MEQYLQPAMEYLRHHPEMGILLTFIIALVESLPLLGTLFPGSVTMTAIGALIGASVLLPVETCISAILGAFLGDCFGFWLGDRYHDKIRLIWPINKLGKYLNYSEKFFSKHGGKSIIIGRFIGPTRAAMPMIAGILRYSWKRFLPAAIFAALLWSLVYMAPGVLLGALAMEFPRGEMTKVFLYGLAVIVGLWLIFWILQFFFKQLSRAINYYLQQWWDWLSQSKSGLFQSSPVKPESTQNVQKWTLMGFNKIALRLFVRLIYNRQDPRDYRQLKLTLLFLLSSLLFLFLWFAVIHHRFIARLNEPLFYLIQSFRTPKSDRFWAFLTVLGTPEALLVMSLLAALGLLIYKQWRTGIHLALLGLMSAAAAVIVKKLYFSPRPTGFVLVDPSSSFPSGHTLMSIAVFSFLAFLTTRIISQSWRQLIYGSSIILILLISIARLFSGQHWFTDMIGGWLLGLSILLLITISYRRMPKTKSILKIQKKTWLGVIAVSVLLPWCTAGLLTYQNTLQQIQPDWSSPKLNFQQWWENPTVSVPLYRQDRFGRISQPFNVQWAGKLEDIQSFLLEQGWDPVIANNSFFQSALQRFTSQQPKHNIPLLPWLYQNKPPAVFFIKHLPDSQDILELRLWQSGIQYTDSSLPLWLGTVIYHTSPEKILPGSILIEKSRRFNVEFRLIRIPLNQQPARIQALHWDGTLFIIQMNSPP